MEPHRPDLGRQHPLEQALYEVKKTIVGQDLLLERMLVALLARGHLLVEGVPGLAKTMAVKTLAQAIGGQFQRIQFTPDLVPADVIGTRIYNQKDGEFQVSLGPVFANLVLADEINRAGQVVGIVTGLANPSQQSFFIGIGFAVPIATAGGAAGAPPQ